jgi:GT2 family glycosyltransferase
MLKFDDNISNLFIDRKLKETKKNSIDIVMSLLHAPDNFQDCVLSYYREIPINRFLIGNAGINQETLSFLEKLPRVIIFDHTKIYSQGYSLQNLFEKVETNWFIYFHSDVSIPQGWYDEMCKYKNQYDWFECKRVDPTSKMQKEFNNQFLNKRAYSGSQMGRKEIFQNIRKIDDDYVFRTEDLFFQQEIEKLGFKYGKVPTTFHFHHIDFDKTPLDQTKVLLETFKSTIKYFSPKNEFNQRTIYVILEKLNKLQKFEETNLIQWTNKTNSEWLPFLKKIIKQRKRNSRIRSMAKKIGIQKSSKLKNLSKSLFRL